MRQVLYLTTTHISDILRLLELGEDVKTTLRDKVGMVVGFHTDLAADEARDPVQRDAAARPQRELSARVLSLRHREARQGGAHLQADSGRVFASVSGGHRSRDLSRVDADGRRRCGAEEGQHHRFLQQRLRRVEQRLPRRHQAKYPVAPCRESFTHASKPRPRSPPPRRLRLRSRAPRESRCRKASSRRRDRPSTACVRASTRRARHLSDNGRRHM